MDYQTASRLWRYEAETGLLVALTGHRAGCVVAGKNGVSKHYRHVEHEGRFYKVHRLGWLLTHGAWPQFEIDHINGVRSDNRLENLRDVPHRINQLNQKHHRTGLKKRDWRSHAP